MMRKRKRKREGVVDVLCCAVLCCLLCCSVTCSGGVATDGMCFEELLLAIHTDCLNVLDCLFDCLFELSRFCFFISNK